MLLFVVSLKSKSISPLIHLKIKMQRCLCLLIPKDVQLSSFRASVAEGVEEHLVLVWRLCFPVFEESSLVLTTELFLSPQIMSA